MEVGLEMGGGRKGEFYNYILMNFFKKYLLSNSLCNYNSGKIKTPQCKKKN